MGRSPAGGPARLSRRLAGRPRWAPACAALVTLAVTLWKIQVPSLWRDEAATQSATQRSFTGLIAMLGHVDAVHGTYYAAMWLEVRLAGHSELALRLPSALAMAAAAALITVTGRRLVSGRAGLAAGLTFAALPAVSWFAQDARPFALETAAGAAASYFLVRLAEDGGRGRWARCYAASLVALGLTNMFGLLLIPAHALTVAAWRGRYPRQALARRWFRAATIACLVLLPLMAAAWAQRAQVGWLRPPGAVAALATGRLVGPAGLLLAVMVLTGMGLAYAALGHRLAADWPLRLPALCLPWLLVPPLMLFAASQFQPAYTFRYIVFCMPAAALLIGTGLAAAGRVAGPAGLALIVLLALPAQMGERGPSGHTDNIRGLDQIVARYERPGDAVLYPQTGSRTFAAAYPYGLIRLNDVMLGESAARSGTIAGTDSRAPVVRARLGRVTRVWVIQSNVPSPGRPAELRGLPFRLVREWQVTVSWLCLYEYQA
ncbi:MAG: glycosyltransferase family 39 protein [Streptosporangiaceae bacterium]